ncbi:MAG: hypothetical protein JWP69_1942 [Flaviaesturariibacter sp.]|nr:hypothetical protein [Flaviaesturariibacter sp.]
MLSKNSIRRHLKRKLATAVLITVSAAAFATLGDGSSKKFNVRTDHSKLLSYKPAPAYKTFSLKSGYNYRGNNILSNTSTNRFIMLNTVVTYQKGNATYILPLKKKVFLDKVKFTPTPSRY